MRMGRIMIVLWFLEREMVNFLKLDLCLVMLPISHKVTSKMFHGCDLDGTKSPYRIVVLHKTGTLGPSGRLGSIPSVGVK